MNNSVLATCTDEEVREALFDIGDLKALGLQPFLENILVYVGG